MTPAEFKSQYIASLPEVPEELREELDLERFVAFPADRVAALGISPEDTALLAEVGLPANASPYLNFDLDSNHQLAPVDGFPRMRAIGINGCGDCLSIDMDRSGEVVYLNHDDQMRRVFINSSVSLFAESLCLFSSHLHRNDPSGFVAAIARLDPPAVEDEAFWRTEAETITAIKG